MSGHVAHFKHEADLNFDSSQQPELFYFILTDYTARDMS